METMRKQNESARRDQSSNMIDDSGPMRLEDIQISYRSNTNTKDIKN